MMAEMMGGNKPKDNTALKSVMTEDGKKTMEEETEILLYKLVNLLISKYVINN